MRMFNSIRDAVYGNRRRPPPVTDSFPNPNRTEPQAIDIENHLDAIPGADHLNWRTSIVDLLDLIGVDSSAEAREALAEELGYPGPAVQSLDMDNWLHTRVLADLAGEGAAVPPEVSE